MAIDNPVHLGLAFGLRWLSDFPLPLFDQTGSGGLEDVRVERRPWPVAALGPGALGGRFIVDGDRVRLMSGDEDAIDVVGTDRIEVAQAEPGPLPRHFFGSAVAALLAARGTTPLHASAVEFHGRAILVCGPAGAGKSSAAAAMIGLGGRLISDDLSAIVLDDAGSPCALPGRTGLRLHPGMASVLGSRTGAAGPVADIGGKLCFMPPHVGGVAPIPLGRMVHLDAVATDIPSQFAAGLLNQYIFRPRALARMGGRDTRFSTIKAAVARIPLERQAAVREGPEHRVVDQARRLAATLVRPTDSNLA